MQLPPLPLLTPPPASALQPSCTDTHHNLIHQNELFRGCSGWHGIHPSIVAFIHPFIVAFIHPFIVAFIHPFIVAFIHPSIVAFIHPFIVAVIHRCIHSSIHRCSHSSLHSFILSSLQSFIHLSLHSFIHSSLHSFIHSSLHSFIHLSLHSFIHSSGQRTNIGLTVCTPIFMLFFFPVQLSQLLFLHPCVYLRLSAFLSASVCPCRLSLSPPHTPPPLFSVFFSFSFLFWS